MWSIAAILYSAGLESHIVFSCHFIFNILEFQTFSAFSLWYLHFWRIYLIGHFHCFFASPRNFFFLELSLHQICRMFLELWLLRSLIPVRWATGTIKNITNDTRIYKGISLNIENSLSQGRTDRRSFMNLKCEPKAMRDPGVAVDVEDRHIKKPWGL